MQARMSHKNMFKKKLKLTSKHLDEILRPIKRRNMRSISRYNTPRNFLNQLKAEQKKIKTNILKPEMINLQPTR